MRIGDVQRVTGLTRKALLYYEQEGLIEPGSDPANEYREYSEADVARLLRISVLRQIGLSVAEIRAVLADPDRWSDVLSAHLERLTRQIAAAELTASAIRAALEHQGGDEGVRRLELLRRSLELDAMGREGFMREQIERLFPGRFGQLLGAHYGFFLDEPLEAEEQRQAWLRMVAFLDEAESLPGVEIPDGVDLAEIERGLQEMVNAVLAMDPAFVAQVRESLDRQAQVMAEEPEVGTYLERAAAERAALRGRMTAAGYPDGVTANLRVLSSKFDRYLTRMMEIGRELGIGESRNTEHSR